MTFKSKTNGQLAGQSVRLLAYLGFALILFIAFWLRTHEISKIPPGIHFDEGLKMMRFYRIANGYGLPMDFAEAPEPFDQFLKGTYGYFVGVKPTNMRTFDGLLGVLGVAATIGASRALFKRHRDLAALIAGLAIAVNPSAVIIGRAIYRANWVIPMTMLALWALTLAWNTRRPRFYIAAGVFAGIGAIMYLAGLFIPITIFGLAVLAMLIDPTIPRRLGNLLRIALATAVVMIPWFYLYIMIPDWLTIRLSNLSGTTGSFLPSPQTFLSQFVQATTLIYSAAPSGPSYNTFTTAFLNPVLLVFFILGVANCLYIGIRRRNIRALSPLVVLIGMLMPAALSNKPLEAIRFGGTFGALALLSGQGIGVLYSQISSIGQVGKRLVLAAAAMLILVSPLYTWDRVHDHFINRLPDDGAYFVVLRQQMEHIIQSKQPVYFPLDYLNYQTSAAYLRPEKFKHIHAYGGEALPDGELFIPYDGTYGSPLIYRPTTSYVLLLPDKGEIIILPPLPPGVTLEDKVRSEGQRLPIPSGIQYPDCPFHSCPNGEKQYLGYSLSVTEANNPFKQVTYRSFVGKQPLAVFDDTLELMDMVAPEVIQPGDLVGVILYWRLKHKTSTDYWTLLQLWDTSINSWGNQDNNFTHIFNWLAPTPMWEPGEVFAEKRWIPVDPHTPAGGYHVVLKVYTQPRSKISPFIHQETVGEFNGWLVGARTRIGSPPNDSPASAVPINAIWINAIQLKQIEFAQPSGSSKSDRLPIKLYWKAVAPPPGDYTLFIHVLDANGQLIGQQDSRPIDLYPTNTWNTGFEFSSVVTIPISAQAVSPFSLELGLYEYPALTRIPVEQNGVKLANDVLIVR